MPAGPGKSSCAARLPSAGRDARVRRRVRRDPGDRLITIVFNIAETCCDLYWWVVILAAVMSNLIAFGVVDTRNRLVWTISDFLYRITEPALRRIRRCMPNFGGIDLSPLVLLLLIWVAQSLLGRHRRSRATATCSAVAVAGDGGRHHRRQGARRAAARPGGGARGGLAVPTRPGRGAGRRRPGQRRLRPQQGSRGAAKPAWRCRPSACRPMHPRPTLLADGRRPERRPGGGRHPGATAAAAAHRRGAVIAAIDPAKDVDGLTTLNAGRLAAGRPVLSLDRPEGTALAPCTPRGVMLLLHGGCARACGAGGCVVLGRSALVGRPVAAMLTAADATVTVAHSRTADLAAECRRADVLVAAVGRARTGARRLARAGCGGDRRRHQPRGGRPAGGRRALRRVRRRGRGDHAGAGRRRADDHRLPAGEHGRRGPGG